MNEHAKSLLGSASVDPDKVETVSHVDAMPQAAQDGGLGTQAREGEVVRKVEWVNDASNVNDRRMYIDGQQWAKVYGWDKASLDARCDALQAAMQRTAAAPSADKLRIAVEASGFLLDRLSDLEQDVNERDFYGHVHPAASRLRQALAALKAEGAK